MNESKNSQQQQKQIGMKVTNMAVIVKFHYPQHHHHHHHRKTDGSMRKENFHMKHKQKVNLTTHKRRMFRAILRKQK